MTVNMARLSGIVELPADFVCGKGEQVELTFTMTMKTRTEDATPQGEDKWVYAFKAESVTVGKAAASGPAPSIPPPVQRPVAPVIPIRQEA